MSNEDFPIKSNPVWLRDVLNGKYHIPAYQRPYEWDEKNIDDFLESIFDGYRDKLDKNEECKPVFFGTIQLNKEDAESEKYDIVDGQQRLTTFLLFLNILQTQQKNDFEKQIHKNYMDVIDFDELKKALNISENGLMHDNNLSRYVTNTNILLGKIDYYYKDFKSKENFYTDVIKFVMDNVYFVRLDTEGMDLSDVVSVFNTINTTGLDLNASDIFKFRYYDYLRKLNDETPWMDKINECYRIIEENNDKYLAKGKDDNRKDQSKIEMSWILDIYKHIICARFGWGFSEVSKSNQKFFDELFKEKRYVDKDALVLAYDSFRNIVEEFVEFWRWIEDSRFNNSNQENAMELFSVNMVDKCRYSRYWTIPFVVAYFKSNGGPWKDYYIDSLRVNLSMFRFFTIYSVINDRVINAVQNKVCTKCFEMFKNLTIAEILSNIHKMLWEELRWVGDTPKEDFYKILESKLFENGSRAHLICTLSALLDEVSAIGQEYQCSDGRKIMVSTKSIQDRIFNWDDNPYDIEHIFAQNNFKDEPQEIKDIFNGVGNLVILDRSINRDIKDSKVEKKAEKYKLSKYISVQKCLLPRIEGRIWNKEAVKARAKDEKDKIKEFMDVVY